MKLPCTNCGRSISSEVPADTVLRAYAICPECLEQESCEPKDTQRIEWIEKAGKRIYKMGFDSVQNNNFFILCEMPDPIGGALLQADTFRELIDKAMIVEKEGLEGITKLKNEK